MTTQAIPMIDLDIQAFRQWLTAQPDGAHWFWTGDHPFWGHTPVTDCIRSQVMAERPGQWDVRTCKNAEPVHMPTEKGYELVKMREWVQSDRADGRAVWKGEWEHYSLPTWAVALHDKLVQNFACSQPLSEQECKLEHVFLLLSEVEQEMAR